MTQIEVPRILIPVTRKNYKSIKTSKEGGSLFCFGGMFEPELNVFNTPLKLSNGQGLVYNSLQKTNWDRVHLGNSGWRVSPARERGSDLWGCLSEELVKSRLKDEDGNLYEVRCSQTFAIMNGGVGDLTYFLDSREEKKLREAFDFGARTILSSFNNKFPPEEREKLGKFFYEDFTTKKYSEESRQTGQEADFIFI